MKKIRFLALLFAVSLTASSQTSIGIKGGLNINDINDNHAPNNTATRIGFHGGLLLNYRARPSFAIQPEVVFSSQGAKYTLNGFYGDVVLNYLNIPVLFQYIARKGLRLETGPQLGLLLGAKIKRNNSVTSDLKSVMNEADFSWAFGLAYLSHSSVGVDARFNLGLTDVFETGGRDSKNRVWQIGLFYMLPR